MDTGKKNMCIIVCSLLMGALFVSYVNTVPSYLYSDLLNGYSQDA